MTLRRLELPGKTLPPALPLIQPLSRPGDSCHGEPSARLRVNEEAVEVLASIAKPVAILSVCGPYRTGKSYLLSRLLGRPGTFELGHSMDACTRGVWLSTTALEFRDHLLLLLDTEGIGSVDGEKGSSEYQLHLLVLTTLLSSTLLYNSTEVPQASDLEQMSVFTHLTKCVAVRKGEAGVPRPEDLQAHLPKFVWLLRNVINLPQDEDGSKVPLKTYVHSQVASYSQQSQLVMETLESLFPSIHFLYLPPPSADPTHTADLDSHWELLEEEFRDKLEEIRLFLFHHVNTKLSFDRTTAVTGADLALLLRDHVEAINSPTGLPNLEGSWVAVMKLRLDAASSEMVDKYAREMEERTAGLLPMEESVSSDSEGEGSGTLMQLHWSLFDECYHELKQTITTFLPHHISEELNTYSQSLLLKFSSTVAEFGTDDLLSTEPPTGGLLFRFVRHNYQLSEERCEKLWDKLFEESGIRNRAIKALNQSKVIDVSPDMAALVEEYMEKAVGPAKLQVLERKRVVDDVGGMLRDLPGPPVNVRLVGRDRDKRKIRWDPPAINPGSAQRYTVQKRGREGWKDVATTSKCWVVLDKQKKRDTEYRVTSWNDGEHSKGEMEEPLVVTTKSVSSAQLEWLSYV